MCLSAYGATPVTAIDTSSKTEVYKNTFDAPDSLSDFKQYNGKFFVSEGKAKLQSYAKSTNAFILYSGKDPAVKSMTDYVVEVDLYNVQTAVGLVAFCELDNAKELIHGYSGYNIFTNSTGTKVAMRASGNDGKSNPTVKVSSVIITPPRAGSLPEAAFFVSSFQDLIHLDLSQEKLSSEYIRGGIISCHPDIFARKLHRLFDRRCVLRRRIQAVHTHPQYLFRIFYNSAECYASLVVFF